MLQPRPELSLLKEYVPGKSIQEIQLKHGLHDVVKIASNENPLGPSPKAKAAFVAAASSLHLYPQGNAPELMNALSQQLGVSVGQLIPGNGSDEILDLVGRAFVRPGDRVLGASSTFSVYETVALSGGAEYVGVPLREWKYDLQAVLAAIDERTRVAFICNPNNPTGTWVTSAEMESFLSRVPSSVLVVVDQAYCEFADSPDFPDLLGCLKRYPNLLLTRTFSKIYGLAALRVGYGIGSPEVIQALWKVKPPFNVNLPAQAAAAAALADRDHYAESLQMARNGQQTFAAALDALGIAYLPTQANFLCIRIGSDVGEMVSWMESQGLIVRWLRSFGMPEWIRVTFGLATENERFVQLLAQWKNNHG